MTEQNNLQPDELAKKFKNIWIIIITVIITAVVIGGGVYLWYKSNLKSITENLRQQIFALQNQIDELQEQSLTKKETAPSTGNQLGAESGIAFSNDYLKVIIPKTWSYQVVNEQSLNITKDNYVLYINPNTMQASGVIGGRFSEIAQGASGPDLVMKMHPSESCGNSEGSDLTDKLKIVNYYISANDNNSWCNIPTGENTLWYFSYVTTKKDGYFGNPAVFGLSADTLRQFVITITYQAAALDDLPVKNSVQHEQKMNELMAILKTIEFK